MSSSPQSPGAQGPASDPAAPPGSAPSVRLRPVATGRPRLPFVGLVENECLKLLRRKRPQLVLVVLAIFLGISTWAQWRQQQLRDRFNPDDDWRPRAERRLANTERRMQTRRIFVGVNRTLRFEAVRLRYHLERDIDPEQRTGPLYARAFAGVASSLLLPLLVTLLVADLVTSERSAGTIKMLLTRPVSRSRVLAAKLLVMALFTSTLVLLSGLLSWLIAGIAFGWQGFDAPVLTGFRNTINGPDLTDVRVAPLWIDTLAAYGLAWFAALVVGAIGVTFSVLFRSTAAAMGTLLALVVSGALLSQLASDWEPTKWIFVTNLPLPQFYSGVPPPVAGMTLAHSVGVLAVWGIGAIAVGMTVFNRRDV
jgi:ABC-2 type transport system permease protein